jgi:ribosomal protein S12 methylthiotransferase
MRGKHRSRPVADLVKEAQELEAQGAKEINLVAQDLGHYGRDVRDGTNLTGLIQTLLHETSVPWYRPLYVYSMGITPELVELFARERRLVKYIDMPIQHANDRMLQLMRRPERQKTIRSKVAWLRQAVPDIAIRTTTLVGFPTETDAEFRELLDFIDEIEFDRLGVFPYSPQDGTRAAVLADDVPDAVKRDRVEQVSELQRAISGERLQELIGTEMEVLVDEGADAGDPGQLIARSAFQADDVDGVTYLRTRGAEGPGDFVRARVVEALDYDLIAEVVA